MTVPRPSAPGGDRVRIGWRLAARFAGLVTAVGSAVTTLIAGLVFAVVGLPTPDVWYPIGYFAAVALVATALHIPWLIRRPPQSRWGVFGRAVLVGYLAVVVVALLAGLYSVPWIALQIPFVAVVVYTATGSFLVPGAVAAVCAPLLGPRLRRWRPARVASPRRPGASP